MFLSVNQMGLLSSFYLSLFNVQVDLKYSHISCTGETEVVVKCERRQVNSLSHSLCFFLSLSFRFEN